VSLVTVDNCDQEPIHIPGAVQPHGVLLALDHRDLRVRMVSENCGSLLGMVPEQLFASPLEEIVDASAAALIREHREAQSFARLNPIATAVRGRTFDAIVHRSDDRLIVELEPTAPMPQGGMRDYGADTHRALVTLQGAGSLDELLSSAAQTVRQVTGHDRVMIYRFHEDGHGQVVAEERPPSLEPPYLGLHYPASDIPAQARRLYALNWLRIIVDVDYRPAALVSAPGAERDPPLDLTHSTLRSVSPIHIEYLRNMGVAASMSVSLLNDGVLWGLIACHHTTPRFVPYPVRMTCELLGRMLSTLILGWERRDEVERQRAAGERRVRLLERLAGADYLTSGLAADPDDLLAVVGAGGAAILEEGRFTAFGRCPPEAAVRAFAAWMAGERHEVLASFRAAELTGAPALGPDAAGVLAVGLPQTENNALIWFRPEVEKTVSWGGSPAKVHAEGPNGQRLTPRGSFALWKETVRDQSARWSPIDIEVARALRAGLTEATVRKAQETERARDMMLGMLSHDLRNPLGTIVLAAEVLKIGDPEPTRVTRASARIAASSDRMRRMIEQLLDFTRARAGTLELSPVAFDLVTLCRELIEEIKGAHPGTRVEAELPASCALVGDPDRIAQVVSNLLGNARHHGDPTRAIRLSLRCSEDQVALVVHNHGQPIPPERLSTIFDPFKRGLVDLRVRKKDAGLGLGLFIVRRLVELHGGQVEITSSAEEGTACTVRLPRPAQGEAPTP
jgi:two-component system, chemotaxis family, sensor kinase Cph1